MSLIIEIQNVTYAIDQVKWKLETEITNKSIPLTERWELWCNAPSFLKNTEKWIEHFEFAGNDIDWSGQCEYRCSTITLQDVVESYEGNLDYAIEEGTESELGYVQEDIDKLKEDILSKNLVSFQWDW